MSKSIFAAILAAAVGLSPVVADAAMHKGKHHKTHTMQKSGEPGTTGMGTGGAAAGKSTGAKSTGGSTGTGSMKQ